MAIIGVVVGVVASGAIATATTGGDNKGVNGSIIIYAKVDGFASTDAKLP